jgi:Cupin superfamily protein
LSTPSVLEVLPPDFFSVYWRQRPLLLRGAVASLIPLVTEEELESYENDYYSAPATWRSNAIGRIGTISFIANAECINQSLAQLCARFRADFKWPPAEVALVRNRELSDSGPHFDEVDNFVTQTSGAKRWRLWPPTDIDSEERRRRLLRTPSYGEIAIPTDPSHVVDVVVEPGDLLYVPLFWGHHVQALGPGISLSLALKALLPSQVLLKGMTAQLSQVTEDSNPLPLPVEVPDWEEQVADSLADAFSILAHRLAPAERQQRPEQAGTAAVAVAGLAEISSNRHEKLLASKPSDTRPPLSPVLQPVGELLEEERIDLEMLVLHPPRPELAKVVDWLGMVHLHRFFSLLSLGPQDWWPQHVGESWARYRDDLESRDVGSLTRVASDARLIELTSEFRRHLQAFNRRHAIVTLERWADHVEHRLASDEAGDLDVFSDAGCTLPSEGPIATLVRDGLAIVDKTWPGFSATFEEVVGAVAAVRSGLQARAAAGRALVAVTDADWPVHQVAEALVGELARVSVQVIERIGVTNPGFRPSYEGGWSAASTEFSRAGALVAVARYLEDIGKPDQASAKRRLAAGLLGGQAEGNGLTSLGRDLLEVLTRSGSAQTTSTTRGRPSLRTLIEDLESLDVAHAWELDKGLTTNKFRFQWSNLGRPSDTPPAGLKPTSGGMDCGIPPWLTP